MTAMNSYKYLELFQQKLQANIPSQFDDKTHIIRFQDGSEIPATEPLSMIRPNCEGIDSSKTYTFGSLWLLIDCFLKSSAISSYIMQAKRLSIPHLPWQERKSTHSYLMGEIEECDLLLQTGGTQQSGPGGKAIKRQKVETWSITDISGLEQAVQLPNTGVVFPNTPFFVSDYTLMMASIFTELSTTYFSTESTQSSSSHASKRKSTQPEPFGEFDINQTIAKPLAPIIIVPSGHSTKFSFTNLGDLFANGSYISPNEPPDAFAIQPSLPLDPISEDKRPQYMDKFKHFKKPSQLRQGMNAQFELCSDPSLLSTSQWARVIAVVVTGKAYQFDTFTPFKNKDSTINTTALFEQMAGLFLLLDGDKIPPALTEWNVSQHKLSTTKRHTDQIIMSEVWERIYQAARKKKRVIPNLFF